MSGPQFITPWGLGNYPTGTGLDWAGVPVSLDPNFDFYTPKVPIDTRCLNWNFQRADNEVVAAQQWAIAGANEWQVQSFSGNDGAFTFPSWNPYFGCWMLASADGSGHPTLSISMSPGSGNITAIYTDTTVTTTFGALVPIGVNPANGLGMWFDGSKDSFEERLAGAAQYYRHKTGREVTMVEVPMGEEVAEVKMVGQVLVIPLRFVLPHHMILFSCELDGGHFQAQNAAESVYQEALF